MVSGEIPGKEEEKRLFEAALAWTRQMSEVPGFSAEQEQWLQKQFEESSRNANHRERNLRFWVWLLNREVIITTIEKFVVAYSCSPFQPENVVFFVRLRFFRHFFAQGKKVSLVHLLMEYS
jgi:hypothetical protein